MNKRVAKRRACTIAHLLIDSYIDRDNGGPLTEAEEADEEKIDDALRELSLELLRRGVSEDEAMS